MTTVQKKTEEVKALAKTENGEAKKIGLAADFGTVYIKVTAGGQIMAPVRASMTLFQKMGHIYSQGAKWMITATGYRHLNKVASISIVTPQSVIVDGRPVANPNIERNPRTKAIESVNIRKIGIGYSPAGNIVVLDKTLFYNIYTYFIQSIQAKMKTDAKCAVFGIKGERPKEDGSWTFFETEAPLGIWINYKSAAIIACLDEHTQRQRFGDRIATTIVERNILKDHPALAVSQVSEKQGTAGTMATVEVFGWRNELEPKNIMDIMRQAEASEGSKDFDVKSETIDAAAEEEDVAREETAASEGSPATEKEPPATFFLKQEQEAKGKA